MPTWILQPRDPLIARDGRPFGAEPGARARSLPVPPPSMLAGAWRSFRGKGADGAFDTARIPALLAEGVVGPLLAFREADGEWLWAAPAPADAVIFGESDGPLERRALRPFPAVGPTDLASDLWLCDLDAKAPRAKPAKDTPAYWRWDTFQAWLQAPSDGVFSREAGLQAPAAETRTHVSISSESLTAEEGQLFSTEGRRYESKTAGGWIELALGVRVAADNDTAEGLAPVGGERRLAAWSRAKAGFPTAPAGLVDEIVAKKACRVVLLTPASFTAGWKPDFLLTPRDGVTPALRAACVSRPDIVSGWDLAADNGEGKSRGKAKPTRRLARAGSVYFLTLAGTPEAIRAWAENLWMSCVSDTERDRLDGFGLAVPGTWKGDKA